MKILVSPLLTLLSFASLSASAQVRGAFVPTGDTTVARSQHTATLQADGKVLITGGDGDLSSAELYDPATGTFTPTGSMNAGRRLHTATLLPDGRVLIAGGWNRSSAELYDPTTGTFAATSGMLEDQAGHSATLLLNGKVLIAGGQRAAPPWPTAARAELYDPATGIFSFAANYAGTGTLFPGSGGPVWPTANLLPDGRVLIVSDNPPEIYDPTTGIFALTGPLIHTAYRYGMYWHTGTSLSDGKVLITGGNDDWTCGGFAIAEIYDPSSGTFSAVGNMTASRDIHTATLLHDGTVLTTGGGAGWCSEATLDGAEIYEPSSQSFIAIGFMNRSRVYHTATLLKNGTVLIVGGVSYWPYTTTRSAELYRPDTPVRRNRAVRR